MPNRFTITNAADPRSLDISKRKIQYLLSQLFRLACIVLIVIVDYWPLRIVLASAALFLPWIAVLRANDDRNPRESPVRLYDKLTDREVSACRTAEKHPTSSETGFSNASMVVEIIDEHGETSTLHATLSDPGNETASYRQEKQ